MHNMGTVTLCILLWNYLAKSSVSLDSGEHLSVNNPRNNSWKQEKRQPYFHWRGEIYI